MVGMENMVKVSIEGKLVISNPLSNKSKDIKDSKTYSDWQSGNINHYLQVVQYRNDAFNPEDWQMEQISVYNDNEETNVLLGELFHNEPKDEVEINELLDRHFVKKRHTWRTCNHSFYVYDYWLDVSTNEVVVWSGTSFMSTLTGYFLRGGA